MRQSDELALESGVEGLVILAVLGEGSFGRVSLARVRASGEVLALKCLSKAQLVEARQQRHVVREVEALRWV